MSQERSPDGPPAPDQPGAGQPADPRTGARVTGDVDVPPRSPRRGEATGAGSTRRPGDGTDAERGPRSDPGEGGSQRPPSPGTHDAAADEDASAELYPAELRDGPAAPGASAEDEAELDEAGAQVPPLAGHEDLTNRGVDRSVVIGDGVEALSRWSLRGIIIAVALAGLLWLLGQVWIGVLPIILALIVSTVLWPPTRWLRSKGVPAGLASLLVILGAFAVFFGVIGAITPSLVEQSTSLARAATSGLNDLQNRLARPPFNIDSRTIDDAVTSIEDFIGQRGGDIATGVFSGVNILSNALVTIALVLVLTFFFLKDGPRFLPFVRKMAGRTAGRHLTEVSVRAWNTLGGFIRTQAVVSAVDAVLIGSGLVIMQIPLAFALAVLTFFGGFIPIVGAFAVGALAVLVALVSQGVTSALIVLAIIIVVQQVEGNLLQPFLQGRSMQLHAGVILLSVAVGSTLFGVVGAFLAVPFAAVAAVVLRYLSEQVDLRTGDLRPEDVAVATKEGEISAQQGLLAGAGYSARHHATTHAQEQEDHRAQEDPSLSTRVGASLRAARDTWERHQRDR